MSVAASVGSGQGPGSVVRSGGVLYPVAGMLWGSAAVRPWLVTLAEWVIYASILGRRAYGNACTARQ
jgi:hypothetical protein